MASGGMKRGEKILFGIVGLFVVFAIISFIALEIKRAHSTKPMFVNKTFFTLTKEGAKGSVLFHHHGCTTCHRAMREGTNNGVDLDGIGSKRTLTYLENFLAAPEKTYAKLMHGAKTFDHGPNKEAGYVAKLPAADRHALAVYLSELKAIQGSPDAELPPPGKSDFINEMVKQWAPKSWAKNHEDVRVEAAQKDAKEKQEQEQKQQPKEQGSATNK